MSIYPEDLKFKVSLSLQGNVCFPSYGNGNSYEVLKVKNVPQLRSIDKWYRLENILGFQKIDEFEIERVFNGVQPKLGRICKIAYSDFDSNKSWCVDYIACDYEYIKKWWETILETSEKQKYKIQQLINNLNVSLSKEMEGKIRQTFNVVGF